jgi:hypothetical protein
VALIGNGSNSLYPQRMDIRPCIWHQYLATLKVFGSYCGIRLSLMLRIMSKGSRLMSLTELMYMNHDEYLFRTALHHASELGHQKIVDLLLEKGSNVHLLDKNKQTPLDCAVLPQILLSFRHYVLTKEKKHLNSDSASIGVWPILCIWGKNTNRNNREVGPWNRQESWDCLQQQTQ